MGNLGKNFDVKKAEGLMDKIFGMILSRNWQGLIFKTRFGLHTFFMKKSIDVLVLDQQSRVVRIKEGLKPNRIYLWNPKFDKVVELPGGSIKKSKIRIGDEFIN